MDVIGVTCIKGEIHSLMTLMRLNTRWAAPSRFSRELLIQDESPLVQSFRRLNEYLEDIYDLRDVDCVVYLDPFLQVVVSEHASGPLTSAALSSLNKFTLYGFLSNDMPRASEGINLTAHCISSCVFEETNWESDEIILVKLLELSGTCLRCNASSDLTVSSAWDIFSTCLSIHSQLRASKLLRSEAETTLRHLTLTAFSKTDSVVDRSPPFSGSATIVVDENVAIDDEDPETSIPSKAPLNDTGDTLSSASGLTLFLRKIMFVLSEIMDPQTQSPEQVKFALTLVNIALEAGGPSLGSLRPLVDILRGDVCRHLLRISQSDDMAIFSLALRVVFNLFVSIKDHMKVQLEVFLTSVHLRLLNSSSFCSNSSNGSVSAATPAVVVGASTGESNGSSLSLAREELALESLLEFCREPSLMHDLYTNYDCDVQCTNLFDSIITTLCARAQPSGTQAYAQFSPETAILSDSEETIGSNPKYVNILNRLSFEGALLVLHAVAVRCWTSFREQGSGPQKRRSSMTRRENATPLKKHTNSVLNQLDDDFINHSPVSSNSELSSMVNHIPNDNIFKPAGKIPRSTSASSTYHNLYNEEGFTSDPDNEDDDENDFLMMARLKTAEVLRQRKVKKQKFRLVAEKFNAKPLNGAWVRYASDLGLLPRIPSTTVEGKGGADLVDPKIMARFLKTTAGLDKAAVGEYLSKGPKETYPYHAEVLKEYVNTFDFWKKGKAKSGTFVKALRLFLGQFRLPGEAQCIDRLMEAFANRLFDQLGKDNPFVNADAAFILSFSTIMLNTDLHNPGIADKKRMKKEEFIRNNRGINENADLPQEYLEGIYDEIKDRQIQVDYGIADQAGINAVDIISETQHWDKLIRRADADQTPASFTPTVAARRLKRNVAPRDGPGALVGLGSNSFRIRDTERNHDTGQVYESKMDDNISVTSLSDCPSSIHDGDMFQVMMEPVLEALLAMWESTEDPQLLCKILEGIWDYASVCALLNFSDGFNKLVRIFFEKVVSSIENGAEGTLQDIMSDNTDLGNTNFEILSEKRESFKVNIKKLIKADFDTILLSRKKNAQNSMRELVIRHGIKVLHSENSTGRETSVSGVDECSVDFISWDGAQYVRCQLLLRTLFHICNKYISLLGPAGWTALVRILLWCRRHGDLPENLMEIDDFSDARGGSLEPSVYAMQCHSRKHTSSLNGSVSPSAAASSSLWSSVTSLGSLLWAPDDKNYYESVDDTNEVKGSRNKHLTHVLPHHPLMKDTITACRIDALLFLRIRDISEGALISIVSCILDELNGIYRYDCLEVMETKLTRHTSKVVIVEDPSRHEKLEAVVDKGNSAASSLVPELPRMMSELDGVIIIEWVSRLMFANMHRTKAIWARLHEFFATILERHVDEASLHCPYVIERCAVAIVRAAIHLLHYTAPLTLESNEREDQKNSGEDAELISAVWKSLRLIKGIPGEVVHNLSNRLGAGLLTFIRGSPECSSIRSMEQWYLIFSLLSAVSAGPDGRPFVWEAISYLIDNNLITNLNFSPCRHLVLRFLYRVFPGEVDEEARLQQGIPQASERNPWLTGSLVYLLRLALMACGGYELGFDAATEDVSSAKRYNIKTFPFEDNDDISLLSLSNSPPSVDDFRSTKDSFVNQNVVSRNNSKAGSVIKVVCVVFSHPEEVQLLLVETTKTFSDFVSVMPLAVSKHASFCLQVLLSSCKRVGVDSSVWAAVVRELINRLPLNHSKAMKALEPLCADRSEIDTLCLKSCNIAFEAITLNFWVLRNLDEFQNLWLSFLSLLALNVNGLMELRLSKYTQLVEEFVEMMVALLRFLVPETVATPDGRIAVVDGVSGASRACSDVSSLAGRTSEHCSGTLSARDDISLLYLSWNSILGVCPGIPSFMKKSHSYMLEILSRDPSAYVFLEKLNNGTGNQGITSMVAEMNVPDEPHTQLKEGKESIESNRSYDESNTEQATTILSAAVDSEVRIIEEREENPEISIQPSVKNIVMSSEVLRDDNETTRNYGRMRKIDARTHIV